MTSSPISCLISRGYIIICVSVWEAEFDWKHDYPQQNKNTKLEFLHLFLTATTTVCDHRSIDVHWYVCVKALYPVNQLRNVAQDNTQAEFVLYIDVDFIPNRDLEASVYKHINNGFFNSSRVSAVQLLPCRYSPLPSLRPCRASSSPDYATAKVFIQ